MVSELTVASEFDTAIKSDKLVIVDFFATWCGPCNMIAPVIEKFSDQYSNAEFYKLDVDRLPNVAQQHKVTSMPTLIFYKRGEEISRVVGANPNTIKETIEKCL